MSNRVARSSHDKLSTDVTASSSAELSSIPQIENYPVSTVEIDSLVFDGSPRLSGENTEHTRVLAEADDTLPPITVHAPTMRVIDGTHRVCAAMLNGKSVIDARLLDCDEDAAFFLAVKANVTHGLPLSLADRKAAAARIIASYPQWSDRAIAWSTGLSDKTVSGIRSRLTEKAPQSNARLGKDGRLRPLNSADRRRQAAAMIDDKPEVGLREIARVTGLSPATVRDIRQRTDRGEDPVPPKYRPLDNIDSTMTPLLVRNSDSQTKRRDGCVDRHALLAKLRNDPSLKFSEAGRYTLRLLHHHTVDFESCETLCRSVPDRWKTIVADLARNSAAAWTRLAEQLEQRSCEASS